MSLRLFLYKIIDHLQTFIRLKLIAVLMLNVVTLDNGKKVNVHFVYNKITRQFDDFKFK